MIRVTVWNENLHDRTSDAVKKVYPQGIHGALASFLARMEDVEVRTATLDQPDCGLPDEVLENTDVMLWWGHMQHDKVPDELAQKVADRVRRGMGLIVLHSGHYSKPFRLLMGTTCSLRWREGDFERLWCVNPAHPITAGVPAFLELEQEEMYGEHFDIPQPDELVYAGRFRGGELCRSGCCWYRGAGKVFYFQPGHETYPTYHHPEVQKILCNAVRWAAPVRYRTTLECFHDDRTTEEMSRIGAEIGQY